LPAAPIQAFQAYLIGPDGHIIMRVDLHCADEDSAKESAQQLVDGNAAELWQQDRKIATFTPCAPPRDESASSITPPEH
jgi:hypothetical protein